MRLRRLAVPAAFAVLTLAACGTAAPDKPMPRFGDGGFTADDGGSGAAIGAKCVQDGDCASGHCDTQTGGGYCLQGCLVNTSCPTGSACERVGRADSYCLALCKSDADCRAGTVCAVEQAVCVPVSGCRTHLDCPGHRACDRATHFCEGATGGGNAVGGECTQDPQCTEGYMPACLVAPGVPGGYCSGSCVQDADCGAGNWCVGGLALDQSGSPLQLCMQGCRATADCRSGYSCLDVGGKKFCYAPCKTNNDCLTSGATCDVTSGLCSGGGPATGMDDGGTPAPDAGPATDGGLLPPNDAGFPGPRPAAPQVVTRSGPVLKNPRFVPIFFANDDPTIVALISDFDKKIGATKIWATIGADYGVGAATSEPAVVVPEVATGTVDDGYIERWLQRLVDAKVVPAADDNTLYILHFPPSLTTILGSGLSCQTFLGYHSDFFLSDGTDVAYAVMPRCFDPTLSALDVETSTETHEMAEAASDPYPQTAPAYSQADALHLEWQYFLGGSENGDLCGDASDNAKFPELPYEVQRIWSNSAAAAGRDPCQPELPGEIFFVAAPELDDDIPLGGRAVKGVTLGTSKSRTIGVDLTSEGPFPPWTVTVADYGSLSGGPSAFVYSLDRPRGRNGDRLQLTLTAIPGVTPTASLFLVTSTADDGKTSHSWVGIAGP